MKRGASIDDVLGGVARFHIARARAERFADRLPAGCVNLLVLDPPYYGMKDEAWDNVWPSEETFLTWIGEQCARWRRVLAPNGSLYVFAKPQATRRGATMASRVEAMLAEHFAVLNQITWRKPNLVDNKCPPKCGNDLQRNFVGFSERVIFAEQYGADSKAMGEAQYDARCDELRGFVFEPIRAYLDEERERAGLSRAQVDAALGNQMSGHYFSRSQWTLPTEPNYEKMRAAFNRALGARGRALLGKPHDVLAKEYEALAREYQVLRREYDDLKAEFQRLRRPFSVSAKVPYTDVWDYPTVGHYKGKHPCEKPRDMAHDIVAASSRPGDVVADFFSGSGQFLGEAVRLGRRAIGCDMDERWARATRDRCAAAAACAPAEEGAAPARAA